MEHKSATMEFMEPIIKPELCSAGGGITVATINTTDLKSSQIPEISAMIHNLQLSDSKLLEMKPLPNIDFLVPEDLKEEVMNGIQHDINMLPQTKLTSDELLQLYNPEDTIGDTRRKHKVVNYFSAKMVENNKKPDPINENAKVIINELLPELNLITDEETAFPLLQIPKAFMEESLSSLVAYLNYLKEKIRENTPNEIELLKYKYRVTVALIIVVSTISCFSIEELSKLEHFFTRFAFLFQMAKLIKQTGRFILITSTPVNYTVLGMIVGSYGMSDIFKQSQDFLKTVSTDTINIAIGCAENVPSVVRVLNNTVMCVCKTFVSNIRVIVDSLVPQFEMSGKFMLGKFNDYLSSVSSSSVSSSLTTASSVISFLTNSSTKTMKKFAEYILSNALPQHTPPNTPPFSPLTQSSFGSPLGSQSLLDVNTPTSDVGTPRGRREIKDQDTTPNRDRSRSRDQKKTGGKRRTKRRKTKRSKRRKTRRRIRRRTNRRQKRSSRR